MFTFHCNISGRIYGFPSVLAPHLTGTASVGVWCGCPCCRDNLTLTLPPLQPSREWLLIKCSSPHPQSNLRPEVLSGGLLSSAELSALCYCADRGKWQCSSLPLNDSVLIQPVSTPEQSNRKKKKEGKITRIGKWILTHCSEVLLQVGLFRKVLVICSKDTQLYAGEQPAGFACYLCCLLSRGVQGTFLERAQCS